MVHGGTCTPTMRHVDVWVTIARPAHVAPHGPTCLPAYPRVVSTATLRLRRTSHVRDYAALAEHAPLLGMSRR